MDDYNHFEAIYSTLMDKSLSIELKDDTFIASYIENGGAIKSETISKKVYANLLEEIRYRMKLSINAIYLPETLNCFIENGVLYLDENIPFSVQMKAIDELKVYFYISYKKIKYDGPLSFIEKLCNKGSLVKKEENEDKTSAIKAKIRMNITKLDTPFKNYVEHRIRKIYSNPEERLESITDLTKPIGDLGTFNIQEELEKLYEQMNILIKANNYINKTELEKQARVSAAMSKVDNRIKTVFANQINEAYQDNYNIIRTNAINEIEGREYRPLEEISLEFENKIEAIFRLLTEYYTKNLNIFGFIYGEEGNQEVINARINTIYSYFGIKNPYIETINKYKINIKKSLNEQKECTELVEEYNSFLEKALVESEDKAFRLSIEGWKTYNNQAAIVSNPIFIKIGEEVENYNKVIKTTATYKINKELGYRKARENVVEEEIYEYYEEEYQSIIDGIARVYAKDNKNSISPLNKDAEYEKLLTQLQNLTSIVQKDLKNKQIQKSINNLINNDMTNETIGDSNFNVIFEKVSDAYYEISQIIGFTEIDNLINLAVLENHLQIIQIEYQRILKRIEDYYKKEHQLVDEYDNIIKDLDKLIGVAKQIYENENKIIHKHEFYASQKNIM